MYKFLLKELVSMGERCLNWQIVFSKCFYKQLITFRDLNFKLLCQGTWRGGHCLNMDKYAVLAFRPWPRFVVGFLTSQSEMAETGWRRIVGLLLCCGAGIAQCLLYYAIWWWWQRSPTRGNYQLVSIGSHGRKKPWTPYEVYTTN